RGGGSPDTVASKINGQLNSIFTHSFRGLMTLGGRSFSHTSTLQSEEAVPFAFSARTSNLPESAITGLSILSSVLPSGLELILIRSSCCTRSSLRYHTTAGIGSPSTLQIKLNGSPS